ncbi:hypothetical protein Gferi_09930 [Geosporobacter ferrireducens]|uniref:Uncharacterized protein n=1 Tax=Geosporobacter ferrireducens TaxID=1424294 RepID=A0A1D8GG27_9FIRM|nr:hypothetical protein Gferi_09930 [Geosporobacter ferrireducens]
MPMLDFILKLIPVRYKYKDKAAKQCFLQTHLKGFALTARTYIISLSIPAVKSLANFIILREQTGHARPVSFYFSI